MFVFPATCERIFSHVWDDIPLSTDRCKAHAVLYEERDATAVFRHFPQEDAAG